jgi:hypothetical protein
VPCRILVDPIINDLPVPSLSTSRILCIQVIKVMLIVTPQLTVGFTIPPILR